MNRASYNNIAAKWDVARVAFIGREREYLDALMDGLPVASLILDVGCGTGRPLSEYLAGGGHRIVGIDQSEELLERAKSRLPDCEWIHSRIEDYRFDRRYDAVVCWDCLFHIERQHHAGIISEFAKCLSPGGRLMLSVGGSDSPAFTDTMFGREFFYDSHPPEKVVSLVEAAGLRILISELTDLPNGGRDKGKYAIVAQRI